MASNAAGLFHFNGVNGDSGQYALPPMRGEELLAIIRGEGRPENLADLRRREYDKSKTKYGVKQGVDPKKLAQAGWGIIFAHGADPAIKEALSDLLKLRQSQAGDHYRIYEGPTGHRPNESKSKFLARFGMGPGPADPDKVPYYLLIVGDPERIDFRFQYQLDVQYAVGRIHFETLDEYANYARSVVEAERGSVKLPRDIAFLSVANPDDLATQLSTENLAQPLFEQLKTSQQDKGWQFKGHWREEATKAQLTRLLGGDQTPALLFTASHGTPFNLDSARQLKHQGALLCQDWPGPQGWSGAIPQDFYFAGDDLDSNANLLGLIAFFFACYGAGTPRLDEFAKQAFDDTRQQIAPHNFLAQLPVKMLSQPRGGALAVIGHVDRAWSYSFNWPGAGRQTEVFNSAIRGMLNGYPVGAALEYFNARYAELATVLSDELENAGFNSPVVPYELASLWTANNDARGYAIIGDPAVRMPVVEAGQASTERSAIVVQPTARPTETEKPAEAEQPEKEVAKETVAASHFSIAFGGDGSAKRFADLKEVTITTYTEVAGEHIVAAKTTLEFSGDEVKVLNEDAASDASNVLEQHDQWVQEVIRARKATL